MAMKKLTDFTSYADAQANFASTKLWELFDGDRERLNIAHECIDRHVDGEKTAVIVVKASGGEEILSYRRISEDSSRFAYWLTAKGVVPGDRVAIKLEPSRAFYAAVFGAMKAGAIAVPLFTLFGPDGVKLRVEDCKPKLLIEDDGFLEELSAYPDTFEPTPRADDLAVRAGYRIAQQNCYRCHNMGAEGGQKSGIAWNVLSVLSMHSTDFFTAYVRNPQSKTPQAQMPGNPSYNEATIQAITSYFQTFSAKENP